MSKLLEMIIDVTEDAFATIILFVKNNLMNFVNIISLLLPFVMYFIGKGSFTVGPEIIIPIFILIFIYYVKSIANKIGKGITVPIPEKRFTEVDDEGEVSIENARIQELILYTADLEDWLERKGLL